MRASFVLALVLVAGAGCSRPKPTPAPVQHSDARFDFRPTAWEAFPAEEARAPKKYVVEELLCAGGCDRLCASLDARDAARCALDLAYADDADARALAREIFESTGAVPGLETRKDIDAAHLGQIPIEPVLPTGAYRKHLAWIRDALFEVDGTFADVARRAPRAVMFRTRPHGFRFFRTAAPSYPSAYAIEGMIGWNVEGPLHDSGGSVAATLLHEIFHLNDEARGFWTESRLAAVFDRIIELCGDDHECLTPYAPADDLVDGGTYYPFDSRTRDVREYGAELALRWYREVRAGGAIEPFKCATPENAAAWQALVDEFFGGFDPTRCVLQQSSSRAVE